MISLPGSQRVQISESVREIVNQDGAALLDIRQGLCFSINPVGTRIWEMLKKEYALEQIAQELQAEFSLPNRRIENDVAEFVEQLARCKLVRFEDQKTEKAGDPVSDCAQAD